MRMLITAMLITLLAFPARSEDWQPIVLVARSIEHTASGGLKIHLASGGDILLAKEDWSPEWSDAVGRTLVQQEAERAARADSEPPVDALALPIIRSKCASEWPDDFRMQKYCQDQQFEGLRALRSRVMAGPLAPIRSKCAQEWLDDFRMRDYCETQQLEALRQLNR